MPECPTCSSENTRLLSKRNTFYPLAPAALFGWAVCALQQVPEPGIWMCRSCGHRFPKRTVLGILFWNILLIWIFLTLATCSLVFTY